MSTLGSMFTTLSVLTTAENKSIIPLFFNDGSKEARKADFADLISDSSLNCRVFGDASCCFGSFFRLEQEKKSRLEQGTNMGFAGRTQQDNRSTEVPFSRLNFCPLEKLVSQPP